MVEVACMVPEVKKGYAKEAPPDPHPVQEVTVRLPRLATLARRSVVDARPETYRLVEVAEVMMAFVAVKF